MSRIFNVSQPVPKLHPTSGYYIDAKGKALFKADANLIEMFNKWSGKATLVPDIGLVDIVGNVYHDNGQYKGNIHDFNKLLPDDVKAAMTRELKAMQNGGIQQQYQMQQQMPLEQQERQLSMQYPKQPQMGFNNPNALGGQTMQQQGGTGFPPANNTPMNNAPMNNNISSNGSTPTMEELVRIAGGNNEILQTLINTYGISRDNSNNGMNSYNGGNPMEVVNKTDLAAEMALTAANNPTLDTTGYIEIEKGIFVRAEVLGRIERGIGTEEDYAEFDDALAMINSLPLKGSVKNHSINKERVDKQLAEINNNNISREVINEAVKPKPTTDVEANIHEGFSRELSELKQMILSLHENKMNVNATPEPEPVKPVEVVENERANIPKTQATSRPVESDRTFNFIKMDDIKRPSEDLAVELAFICDDLDSDDDYGFVTPNSIVTIIGASHYEDIVNSSHNVARSFFAKAAKILNISPSTTYTGEALKTLVNFTKNHVAILENDSINKDIPTISVAFSEQYLLNKSMELYRAIGNMELDKSYANSELIHELVKTISGKLEDGFLTVKCFDKELLVICKGDETYIKRTY